MLNLFSLLLSLALLISSEAYAQSCLVPKEKNWHFVDIILSSNNSLDFKIKQLEQACSPHDPNHEDWTKQNDSLPSDLRFRSLFNIYSMIDSFRTLSGSELRENYMKELKIIKKIRSPNERVQKTYELFLKYKTKYDHDELMLIEGKAEGQARDITYTPGQTLERLAVCRDYARLLNYSLKVVAAPISSSWEPVFTSSIEANQAHAWVDVRVPVVDEQGRVNGFRDISLDPTTFDEIYVPLMPFNQNFSPEERKDNWFKCNEILSCLSQHT